MYFERTKSTALPSPSVCTSLWQDNCTLVFEVSDMKSIFTHSILLFFCLNLQAEEYSFHCEKKFFKSGQLSSQKCYDKDKRFGKAIAYNIKGEIIYEKELRTIGGHASVYFSYHTNGAVQKAEWSSAPDAGIQWYNATDVFDENGKKISHTENNYDDYLRVTTPFIVPVKDTVIKQSPIVPGKKATLISNKNFIEVWCINHTYYPVVVNVKDKKTYAGVAETILQPADSVKIIQYKFAKEVNEPHKKYQISVSALNKGDGKNPVVKSIKKKKLTQNDVFYCMIENK